MKKQGTKPMDIKESLFRVCVIVVPSPWLTNRLFLTSLTKILEPITEPLYLISGNLPREIFSQHVRFVDVGAAPIYNRAALPKWIWMPISAFRLLLIQVKMSLHLLRISRNIDVVFFYLSSYYQLPLLIAKILGKKTVLLQGGSVSPAAIASTALTPLTAKLGRWIIKLNCTLADYIVPKAKRLAYEYSNYPGKVLLHGARFVDTEMFKVKKGIYQRENLVGYIGRLSREKGVMNFIDAIPLVLAKRDDIRFVIKGDGPLLPEIQEKLSHYPQHIVSSVEWVSHEELSDYLNQMKLFVLASFFVDTTPQVVQEAMACGTPVLAGAIGDIPDMIKDNETGFILQDSSPQCIADSIIRALEYPKLEEIAGNAINVIEREYTYEAAVERHRRILSRVVKGSDT